MKVVFKTSELNSPLEIFSGTNINSYGSNTKRLIVKKLAICSSSEVAVSVYIKAINIADNTTVIRRLAYAEIISENEVVDIIDADYNFTNEYSIFIEREQTSKVGGGGVVDVYFEYEEVDDNLFVESFLT